MSTEINKSLLPELARQIGKVEEKKPSKDADDIVTYERRNKVVKIGNTGTDDDYIVEEVVVEVGRCNRQAYIAKDADQVGVMNILEKVRRSGDITLFNQTHQVYGDDVVDITNLPSDVEGLKASILQGQTAYEGLPKEIFGNMTYSEVAEMSQEQIVSKINEYIAGLSANKEGETK